MLWIFLKSTKCRSFPFGFFWANIGLAYFENSKVVIIRIYVAWPVPLRCLPLSLLALGGSGCRLGNRPRVSILPRIPHSCLCRISASQRYHETIYPLIILQFFSS